MKRVNKEVILISTILLIALSIRLWGISYDLPYIYHPDEPWPIRIAFNMLQSHNLNPHFFDWPSLIIYVNLFIEAIYYSSTIVNKLMLGLGQPSGVMGPLVELTMGVTYTRVPIIVLLARLVTVGMGIGTILATIWAGKKLFRDIKVGALAGILMAVSLTNVSLNRFNTPDSYATFFLSAVFLASIYIYQEGRTSAYVITGICLGLAVSSKYNSGLIIVVFLVGHFLRTGWRGFKDYRLYLALCLGALAFIATTPYALLDFSAFSVNVLNVNSHYSTGHPGMEGNTLKWYLGYMWRTAGVFYALSVLAILRGIYSRSKELILLSIFPLVYFVFICMFTVRNDRTFLPLTPFLYLLAASFLAYLWNKANKIRLKVMRQSSFLAIICLVLAGLILTTSLTFKSTIQLTTINSRETARLWIDSNLPINSKIVIESYSPFVDISRFTVTGVGQMIDHEPEWYIEQGFDYMVFSQGMFGRYYREPERYKSQIIEYDNLFGQFPLIKKFTDGGYEVRVYRVK
jgi:4-amino-4-deoxy-L-arabinose transferase-like glycosyltransferase